MSDDDSQKLAEVITDLRKIIADLDRARSHGGIYTYGDIQRRLRYTIAQAEKEAS